MGKQSSTNGNNSEAAVLIRNMIEWLMEKRVVNGDAHFSESEMLKLIRELEVFQIEMEMLNEQPAQTAIQPKIENKQNAQGIVLDEARHKFLEEELRDSYVRMENIIKAANIGTWAWNIRTGETIYNDRWGEIIGYQLGELSPSSITTWQKLVHPDDLKRSAELLGRHIAGELTDYVCECRIKHKQGHWVWVLDRGSIITRSTEGEPLMMFGTHTDITERKKHEAEREQMIITLNKALLDIKILKGIVPICANCKKVRDDKGFWDQVETYVEKHSQAQFSHGICPDCVDKIYPTQAEKIRNRLIG